ncbi:hypothetical protein NC651_026640 [Populus alba x Populus x berolinensis]|nr:hypothetical protein NC651_026640 [Populus alba x Populus x berolinensis]
MSKKFNQKKKEEEIAKMVFLLRVDVPLLFVHTFEVDLKGMNELISVDMFYNWKSSRCEKCKVDAPLASMATIEK